MHIADVGRAAALGLLRRPFDAAGVPGMRYGELTTTAPLGAGLLPRPTLGRVGLLAAWEDEGSLERFLVEHPLAARLAHGWSVRLRPTRIFGEWPPLAGLLDGREQPMEDEEPAAVLTIGRLRLSQTVRFLRASAAAESLALRDPSLLAATGLAKPPALVCTFSLWRGTAAMRDYVDGLHEPGHDAAVRAHAARPFHHESAFIRFRPYRSKGSWDGRDPLAATGVAPSS